MKLVRAGELARESIKCWAIIMNAKRMGRGYHEKMETKKSF
jgi:hypothetical protein